MAKKCDIPRHYINGTLVNKLHLTDMFDMFAGTSAGSIQAAGLSIPSPTNATSPKYYAKGVQRIFERGADTMFKMTPHISNWFYFFSFSISILVFTTCCHCYGKHKYQNPRVLAAHNEMLDFLR
jgi:patatin-like phospholipase/acyl hydrolase